MDNKPRPQTSSTFRLPEREQQQPTRQPAPLKQREATLSVVRGELDAIYNGNSSRDNIRTPITPSGETRTIQPRQNKQPEQVQAQPTQVNYEPETSNPYERKRNVPELSSEDAAQWKRYHSAWQNYYQKYYEQYYVKEVEQKIASVKEDVARNQPQSPESAKPSKVQIASDSYEKKTVFTQNEALSELRQSIITKAQSEAKKVRRSRHFLPIASALAVVMVIGLLQYNQVLIANVKAYMTPGALEPQNIIIDPNSSVPVGPEPRMIIPKINVDAPTVYDVGPSNVEQLDAMRNGIAHVKYPGATAMPGQVGNAVFSAHSSSDWVDSGAYKFIFVQLERLKEGDVIYINHDSVRYSYKVFETKTVEPTDIDSLKYNGDKPIITLITCTPLGTAEKRFLVFAEQISPSPSNAERQTEMTPEQVSSSAMTGTSPTSLERLFGRR